VTAPRNGKTDEGGSGAAAKRDRSTAAGSHEVEEVRAILPKKTLGELGRLLAEGDGDIRYERGENHLFFDVGGRMLISRMIDGQFPAYERVIPKGNDKHIEFERDRTNAVKRVRCSERAIPRRQIQITRQSRRHVRAPGSRGSARALPSNIP
jgi:hypothetical protein